MSKQDPLIGRQVRVLADATTGKGRPHPQAGQDGIVKDRTLGGRQYQIQIGDAVINLPLDAFEVIGAESVHTADPADGSYLPLEACAPSRTNRQVLDDEPLRELAATIKLYGVLQPILVRKLPPERLQDTFESQETRRATHEIIAGERRWRAAHLAGLRRIPVLVKEAEAPAALVMQLIENLHRTDLNPLDEARGIQRLIEDHGYTRESAADAVRKSRTHVYESQRLLALCPEAIAAMRDGTLKRSVALLVAQRPTVALQQEFTKRVLTGGPDNGPMSYRSAADLARRNYMTDLAQAPFALDDAQLCPQAGACTTCEKRTGAAPELWDKPGTDVCTDTACYAEKRDAHADQVKRQALERGRTVITGEQAREIMPTENATPAGYLLLDKARKGDAAPLRTLLGQDVPEDKVVLIEAPSGAMVEAVAVRTASRALEAKAEPKPAHDRHSDPTREELDAAYQRRWRARAVEATIDGLAQCTPDEMDYIPSGIALHIMRQLASSVPRVYLLRMFHIDPSDPGAEFDLDDAMEDAAEQDLCVQVQYMLQMVCIHDLKHQPNSNAIYLDELSDLAKVALGRIQQEVQEEMKAEAAQRAAARKPQQPDAAKPNLKPKADKLPKTTKAEAAAAIAQAMNAADTPNTFEPGQAVRVRIDLKNAKGKLLLTKGVEGVLTRKVGDRAWMLDVPDLKDGQGLVADYTELEVLP